MVIAWSSPQAIDEDPIFSDDVLHLIVPRHLVTPDRQALLAKKFITTSETELIESWLNTEWKEYRLKTGLTDVSIKRNAKNVCPCEDSKICPGWSSPVQYCNGCLKDLGVTHIDDDAKT